MVSSWHLDELCGQFDVVAGILEFLRSKLPSVMFEPTVFFKPVALFTSVANVYYDTKAMRGQGQELIR